MSYLARLAIAGIPALLLIVMAIFQTSTDVGGVPSDGAVLFIDPENIEIAKGEKFSLHVAVQAYEPINVVEATVLYPRNTLELVSIDTSDSIIALWVDEPQDTEHTGALHFSGGLYGGGHQGEGVIFTASFIAKESSEVSVEIDDGLVLAHDGEGTQILQQTRDSLVTIVSAPEVSDLSSVGGAGEITTLQLSADLSGDGVVNIVDLGMMLTAMQGSYDDRLDLSDDGNIDAVDLGIVLSYFEKE